MATESPRTLDFASLDNNFGPLLNSDRGSLDFTLLFEQTMLTIVPAIVFSCCAGLRIRSLFIQHRQVTTHILQYLKTGFAFALVAQELTTLVLWAISRVPSSKTAVACATITMCASILLAALSYYEHARSIRTSDILVIYLLLTAVIDVLVARSLWLRKGHTSLAAVATAGAALRTVLLLLELKGKDKILLQDYRNLSQEATSGVLNRRLFWWLNPVFLRGYHSSLKVNELYRLDDSFRSEVLRRKLEGQYKTQSIEQRHRLLFSVLQALRQPILAGVLPRLCLVGLKFAQPFLLHKVSTLADSKTAQNVNERYGMIAATALVYIGLAIFTGYSQHQTFRFITKLRGGLVSMIYGKVTRLPDELSLNDESITLMSTDVDRIANSMQMMHDVWACPVEIAIGIWLLEKQVSYACIVCVIMTIVFTLLTTRVAKHIGPRQAIWNKTVQHRVSVMSRVLASIKGIKMAGLADALTADLQKHRDDELELSKKFRIITVLVNIIASFPQLVSPVLTFAFYFAIAAPSDISQSHIYTALVFVLLLSSSLHGFLGAVPTLASCVGCFDRIQAFLDKVELYDYRAGSNSADSPFETTSAFSGFTGVELQSVKPVSRIGPEVALKLQNVSVGSKVSDCHLLHDLSFTCPKGSFTILTGPVGCGKSVLLKSLIGEFAHHAGTIYVHSRKIGYCAQKSWLCNKSIKSNIIGEHILNPVWYDKVVTATTLDVDLQHIKGGDSTLVGNGGMTLSGGQQHRIALARAIYARPDILLLDDVFSKLDVITSATLFRNLFGPQGLFSAGHTTVVLVTQQYDFFQHANNVIVLATGGTLSQQAKPECLDTETSFVQKIMGRERPEMDTATERQSSDHVATPASCKATPEHEDLARRVGDMSVYKHYIRSIGFGSFLIFICIAACYSFGCNFPQVWLRWLIEAKTVGHDQKVKVYFVVYGLLALVGLLGVGLSIGYTFLVMVPKSAKNLHLNALVTVMRAPLSFFAVTDVSVILNLFSQDMSIVDMMLPASVFRFVVALLNCLAAAAIIVSGTPYLAATIPGMCAILYLIQKFYLRTSRQVRLLDLEARSALYALFTETLEGIATIRSFRWQDSYRERAWRHLDDSQRPYYLMFAIQRWLNVVLNLVLAAVAILLVAFALEFSDTSGSAVAVSLVTLLELNQNLCLLVLGWTSLETSLGAIARLKAFSEKTVAEVDHGSEIPLPANWPQGTVEMCHMTATYNIGSTPCLQDLTLTIPQGYKVGIYGRTGSGKSSILLSMLRLISTTSGSILFDGIDIGTVSLSKLRSSITVVSQDTFGLRGSLRHNLDLSETCTDKQMFQVLQKVGLGPANSLEASQYLNTEFHELNYSGGQMQLFALAKALLHKRNIVLLDEPFSGVDAEFETRFCQVVDREFAGCTILCVTHSQNAQSWFDKIVIMDAGRVVAHGDHRELRGLEDGHVTRSEMN